MKCPICEDVRMREVVKENVQIDVCPDCKGVWLDRGELEKLMQGVKEIQHDYSRMEQQTYRDQDYSVPPQQGYGQPPQSGYGQPNHAPNHGNYPPSYNQQPYYGKGKYGYDKHGRPYKKKKSVFDVFEDLFD